MVGSEQGENNFKAHGYGDRGAAYGTMMWQGPRRRQIKQGMGLDVIGATHLQQLEAAHWEMTKGPDAGARRAWKRLQNVKTPGEGAAIGVDDYERPKDRALNKRVRGGYANAWAKRFAPGAIPDVAAPTVPGASARLPNGALGLLKPKSMPGAPGMVMPESTIPDPSALGPGGIGGASNLNGVAVELRAALDSLKDTSWHSHHTVEVTASGGASARTTGMSAKATGPVRADVGISMPQTKEDSRA